MGKNFNLAVDDPEYVSGVAIITIANVPAGSNLLWVHVVVVYLFTFICFYFLLKLCKKYAAYWREHMQRSTVMSRTVMVCDLPSEIRTDYSLKLLFNALYRGQVKDAGKKKEIYLDVFC